ncbi:hypothetical protein SLS53_005331 [Cytospora paraplurivora]|uniref:Cytochrome P450 n=1 Tax=Cytospora paraplurivora TaxID=2898453 RepID=A0AAN9UDX6_9PEZI
MSGLLAAGQRLLLQIPQQTLPVLLATFIVVCITTRFLSGNNVEPAKHMSTKDARTAPAIPYWIPYFGHIPQLAFNADGFLTGLQRLYPNGAFSLNFLGSTHTIIFKPGLVSSLLDLPAHIADGHAIWKHLMTSCFGYPRSTSDAKTYELMLDDLLTQDNKLLSEATVNQMIDCTIQRLRHNIADFVTFNDSLVDQTEWERSADAATAEDANGETVVAADLLDLVRNFIAMTANVSLLGTDFVENFPEIWEHFWIFDEGLTALAMDLPAFLPINKAIRARRGKSAVMRCLREFEEALETAREDGNPGTQWSDLDNVSPLIQGRVDNVYRKHKMTMRQRTACEFGLLWAMNAHSNTLVFWILWRIYSDAVLLWRIREEIEPYVVLEKPVHGFGAAFGVALRIDSIDVDGLLNKCPLLKAAYIETLRLDGCAWSFNAIREDTIISDEKESPQKLSLPGGTYAHAAHELHHMNPEFFENPTEWRIDRHIKETAPNKKGEKEHVADMGTVRPFGRGVSIFNGHEYAVKEILIFSATIIAMYDMQPVGGGTWKLPKQAKGAATKLPTSSTRVWIKSRVLPTEKVA